MKDENFRFGSSPDDNSDRSHFNERESLAVHGYKPLDELPASIPKKDLPDWVNAEIEGEENKVITLARTKDFSKEGIQAWFIHTGKPEKEVFDIADVVVTFYFEDGSWHLDDTEYPQ